MKNNQKLYFQGNHKSKNYFEGWYFKQQCEDNMIAFIPGINIDAKGVKQAFIQIIYNDSSYNIRYPYEDFYASPDKLYIKIGNNLFEQSGIHLDIHSPENGLHIKGQVAYGAFTPIRSSIMGPFAKVPLMQCNHGIVSLFHSVSGSITVNERAIDFHNGKGYIEKDWGCSFPKDYIWVQCNDFDEDPACVFVSVAHIPFLGMSFKGCIAIVYHEGKEYRLATYNGAKAAVHSKDHMILSNKQFSLEIIMDNSNAQKLHAPQKGDMSRIIYESAMCPAQFTLRENGVIRFKAQSLHASCESEF